MLQRGAMLAGSRRTHMPPALIAAAVIALALAEPAICADTLPAFGNTRALILVLDMSPEMLANGRLDDLQATAAFVVKQAAGRPISVILYAGEAYLASEATTDPETQESIIAVLNGATMPETANRPEEGLELARSMILAGQALAGDAVLFVDRHDQDAIFNRAVINRLIPPREVPGGEENASLAPPVMQDLGIRTGADHDLGRALAQRDRHVARPVTATAMQASESWLVTLSDSPGEYLSKLPAAEHERRATAGLIRP